MNTQVDSNQIPSPEERLTRLAEEWNVPEDTLREQIRQLGRDIERDSHVIHIGLDRLVTDALTDQDRQHLDEGCAFCIELQRTVRPMPDRLEEFVRTARRPVSQDTPVVYWKWASPLMAATLMAATLIAVFGAALPAYQDYKIRSQVSEGDVLNDGLRTLTAENATENARYLVATAKCGAMEKSQAVREEKEERGTALVNKALSDPKNGQGMLKSAIADFCAAGKPASVYGVSAAIMVAGKYPSQAQAYLHAVKQDSATTVE